MRISSREVMTFCRRAPGRQQREAGKRPQPIPCVDFRPRVLVVRARTGVLSRVTDVATSWLLVDAEAAGYERRPLSRPQRPRTEGHRLARAAVIRRRRGTACRSGRPARSVPLSVRRPPTCWATTLATVFLRTCGARADAPNSDPCGCALRSGHGADGRRRSLARPRSGRPQRARVDDVLSACARPTSRRSRKGAGADSSRRLPATRSGCGERRPPF